MQVHSAKALEWNGDAYHRLSDVQFNVAMTLVDQLKLRGDETLLDAGCGSGRITKVLLDRLPRGQIIGADLSPSMLQTARRECVAKAGQKVSFVEADLQTYVTPQPVDGIFSNMALHFVHDHAQMYRNFSECLQPGGFIALQFGNSQPRGPLRANLLQLMNEPPFAEHLHASAFNFRGCDPHSTRNLLQQAGFAEVEVSAHPTEMSDAGRQKMVEFFRTTVQPDCHRLLPSQALRDAFDQRLSSGFATMFEQSFEHLRVLARWPSGD